MVGEPRQVVRHGLSLHLEMELNVLQRQGRLRRERTEEVTLVVAEMPTASAHGDEAVGQVGSLKLPQRYCGDAVVGRAVLAEIAAGERDPLRQQDRGVPSGEGSDAH